MNWILVIGAGSDIASALSHLYARNGSNLYLAGRDEEELKKMAGDLSIRHGVTAKALKFDALDYASHQCFYSALPEPPEGVICAVGLLGDTQKARTEFSECRKILESNFIGCVSILNIVGADFERRKKGFIIGISSVAGDRGRGSNYEYGSAKAGFTAYLSGLRNRMQKSGVRVMTVKPGFVRTRMTEGMSLPPLLTATPEQVAQDIDKAYRRGIDVVYSLWIWRYIMLVIRLIPEFIFKKLSL